MKFRAGDNLLSWTPSTTTTLSSSSSPRAAGPSGRRSRYRVQGRGGLGIKVREADRRARRPGRWHVVGEDDEVLVVMERGKVVRSAVAEVPAKGRDTMGVVFAKPDTGDRIIAVARNTERSLGGTTRTWALGWPGCGRWISRRSRTPGQAVRLHGGPDGLHARLDAGRARRQRRPGRTATSGRRARHRRATRRCRRGRDAGASLNGSKGTTALRCGQREAATVKPWAILVVEQPDRDSATAGRGSAVTRGISAGS